jgi:lysozyme
MTRRTSAKGRALIQQFEGCRLAAYRCSAGKWTCGYGSTGPDVTAHTVWTQTQADARFALDLDRFELGVERLVKVRLNQNQFDALVSLGYNIGLANLAASTLLRLLNAGEYGKAGAEFNRWIHAGGAVLPGLIRRRSAERDLFLARA